MQSTLKIVSIFICLILAFSPLAFASDLSPDSEQEPLEVEDAPFTWVDLDQAAIMKGAEEIKAVTASSYTTTDIYNLLYSALRGSSSSSTYSLPYIANNIKNIADVLTGTASGLNPISNISDALLIHAGDTTYSQAELTGMIWSIVQNIESDLSTLQTLSNQATQQLFETQRTNAKLEYVFSAIEDTINIKWYALSSTFNGASLGFDTNFISSNTNTNDIKVSISFSSDYESNSPAIFRLYVPFYTISRLNDSSYYQLKDIKLYSNGSFSNIYYSGDYFIVNTYNGIYVYFFDFNHFYSGNYYFNFVNTSSRSSSYNVNYVPSFVYIPFDTLDYQIIKTAFYQAKSADSDKHSLDQLVQISAQLSSLAHSSQSGSEAAEALADFIVSPQKQAAEDASSQVINSTLNNFTGSGSGAAKSSDSNAMKDVSGSIQSGLNAGGSVSGATGVFNSGSDFWGWFTQQNSNYINNPYPAPVVNNTRKSSGSGDEIVDFLTPNSNQLQDLLRQGGDLR